MATSNAAVPVPAAPGARLAVPQVVRYTVLVLGAFIALVPLLYLLANSLKTYGETVTRVSANPFSPQFWFLVPQWDNYRVAWVEGDGLLPYFRNSLVIALVTVTGIFATSIPAAFAFAKLRFRGRDTIFAVLLLTLMVPESVLLIPNFLTVSRLGWVNRLPALTVPFMATAFDIFLLRQFFKQIPDSLLESARIDGSSNFGALARIVVPLSTAPLFTVGFLAFTNAWNALQWPLVVTNTPAWRPISVGLARFISEQGPQTHIRMAGALLALLPVVAVYLIAQRQITEAITRTGLKG